MGNSSSLRTPLDLCVQTLCSHCCSAWPRSDRSSEHNQGELTTACQSGRLVTVVDVSIHAALVEYCSINALVLGSKFMEAVIPDTT